LTEGGEQRPIRLGQLRTSDLPLEHAQLMAQQQDLDLLLPLGTTPQDHKFQQPPQRAVEKGQSHSPRTTRHRR
jgi:hypothetical protein